MTRDPHGQEILTDGAERIPGLSQAFGAGIRAQWIATRREGALLVTGATGGERSDLTDWLIGAILCEAQVEVRPCGTCWSCHQFASGRHPDLHFLQSASGRIGVDEIRELADELTLTSHRGGRKVGWLPQAERMTDAAANAFLKTLEEPPGPTVFILETGRPLGLKATIRSRCEKLRIRTLHTVPTADPAGGGRCSIRGTPRPDCGLCPPARWGDRAHRSREIPRRFFSCRSRARVEPLVRIRRPLPTGLALSAGPAGTTPHPARTFDAGESHPAVYSST